MGSPDESGDVRGSGDRNANATIQSNGCLVAASRETSRITHVSENFMGLISDSAQMADPALVLGTPVSEWIGPAWDEAVLITNNSARSHIIRPPAGARLDSGCWECFAYGDQNYIVLHFTERVHGAARMSLNELDAQLLSLRSATTVADLFKNALNGMLRTCSFDRVEAVRIRPDGPASLLFDVHRRDLITQPLNDPLALQDALVELRTFRPNERFRLVADSHSAPVPVLVADNESALDLSVAYLRGVPDTHRHFLAQAGVHSALSIAIRQDGAVWGQIMCYTYSPHFSRGICWYEVRGLASVCVDAIESRLASIIASQATERVNRLRQGIAASFEKTQHRGLVDDVFKAWLLSAVDTLEFSFVGFIDERLSLLVHEGNTYSTEQDWRQVLESLYYMNYSIARERILHRTDLQASEDWLVECPPELGSMAGVHIIESSERPGLLVIVGWEVSEDDAQPQYWSHDEAARFNDYTNILENWLEIYENVGLRNELRVHHYSNVTTGLLNRRFLRDYLAGNLPLDMADVYPGHRANVFMLVDVREFKAFNQRKGHTAGDAYLRALAKLLRSVFHTAALVMHLDSDNFAVLFDGGKSDASGLKCSAKELIETLLEKAAHLSGELSPTLSIGAISCDGQSTSYSQLVIAADRQLLSAETRGDAYSLAFG